MPKEIKGILALKVLLDLKVIKALKVLLDLKVLKVLLVLKVLKDQLEQKAQLVLKV